MPWGGHPLCGRPAGYLPPGTVGQWRPATLQWRTESRAATRKPTRRGRLGPRAGIPKRKLPNCQRQKRYSRISVGCIQHSAKGRGPRTPASWRHWLVRVVAATAGMLPVSGLFRLRRYMSELSVCTSSQFASSMQMPCSTVVSFTKAPWTFFTLFYVKVNFGSCVGSPSWWLCWSSPKTMMCAREYLYLEVLNYEVPLVMSPVIQATGQRFVHNWLWLHLAERAR